MPPRVVVYTKQLFKGKGIFKIQLFPGIIFVKRFIPLVAFVASLPLMAQVVPGDRYRTIETNHFYIHYPLGDAERSAAYRFASVFESVHSQLEEIYQSGVEKTHVTLVFRTDTVNAFATPLGLDRIVLYLDSPRLGDFSRYDRWVEMLFTHEYTHILTMRQIPGPNNWFLRILLGVPPMIFTPQGFVEGTAVFEESKSGKGRLNDPLTDMVIRTAILENSFPSQGEVLSGSHRWPYGTMYYLYGGKLVEYMSNTYSREEMVRFWKKDEIPFDIDSRFPYAAPNYPRIYEEYKKAVAEPFIAQIDKLKSQSTPLTRLTHDGNHKDFLQLAPNGELFYFAIPPASHPGIYSYNIEAQEISRERMARASAGFATTSVNDDVFLISSEDYFFYPGFGLRYELYDTQRWVFKRLRRGESASYPSISKDAHRLYYISRDSNKRNLYSCERDNDGDVSNCNTILTSDLEGILQFTTLSPDNTKLATLFRPSKTGYANLMVCDLKNNTGCTPIVGGENIKTQPWFSEDGSRIYFSSDADKIYSIYSVSVETKIVQKHTTTLTGLFSPVVSGDSLYALSYFSNGYDLVQIKLKDLSEETVNVFPIAETLPDTETLSPVESTESAYWGIFSIRPYLTGVIGPVSILTFGIAAEDPLFRHYFYAGAGAGVYPTYYGGYKYSRFVVGFEALGFSDMHDDPRASYCREDNQIIQFLCDEENQSYGDYLTGGLTFVDQGRWINTQIILGYSAYKYRYVERYADERRFQGRHMNLAGPSGAIAFGKTEYYAKSISPEQGFSFVIQGEAYQDTVSAMITDVPRRDSERAIEYGIVEGGLALYLPSFFDHHVNYASAYGYSSVGRDRDIQTVPLSRFVRGLSKNIADENRSAAVFTYEYRLPVAWVSSHIVDSFPSLMIRGVGLGLFYESGASFLNKIEDAEWAHAYGMRITTGINAFYLPLPEISFQIARGTGKAGQTSYEVAFSTSLGDLGSQPDPTLRRRRVLPGYKDRAGYFRDSRAGGFLD